MDDVEQCTNEDCELFEVPVEVDNDDEEFVAQLGICPVCGVTREYA